MPDPDFESHFDLQFNAGNIAGLTNEFIFDSDEGSPLPNRPASSGADSCEAMTDAPVDYGSPSEALGLVSDNSPQSMESFHEDMFDSESSKRTSSTASTKMTMGDLPMDGAGVKTNWDLAELLSGTAADDYPMAHNTFDFTNTAALRSDLRSPTDSPSPFASGINPFSPSSTGLQDMSVSRASPMSDGGLSFQTACDDGLSVTLPASCGPTCNMLTNPKSFHFEPPGSTGAPSYTPDSLCLRPPPLITSPPPKYDFRGAPQDTGTFSPRMSGISNMRQPANAPLFSDTSRVPVRHAFEHHQYGPGPYRLEVDANNSKSRVETQIAIRLRLSHLPPGVTKIHLPKHTISKTKLWAKPPAEPSPDTLELHAALVCTSAMQVQKQRGAALRRAQDAARLGKQGPNLATDGDADELKPQDGGDVNICEQCIGRERKRAGRKKLKNPEDEVAWINDEARRVIVFNTHEVKEWALQSPPEFGSRPYYQVEAPMRIACYCRHHAEKLGFQIVFTLSDHHGQVVAQTLSPSIMITDDHKNTSPKPAPGARTRKLSPTRRDMPAQSTPGLTASLESSPSLDLQAARRNSSGPTPILAVPAEPLHPALAAQPHRLISRPASPSLLPGGPAKRRRANKSVKIPSDLTMTRLETALPPGARRHKQAVSAGPLTPATSPFPPTPPAAFPPLADPSLFGANTAPPEQLTNPFGNSPQTGGSNNQLLFTNLSRASSLVNLTLPMFGPPGSAHSMPSASPNPPRPMPNGAAGQARSPPAQAQPSIFKVIPGEGPVAGGIEVTLMGQGFYNGMHVMFGDKQAPATTFWSSESLVCLLPPSEAGGMVPVTLREQNAQLNVAPQWFRYVDDSEQQLLRTALMILGNKMTGGYEDVADFARRIINEASNCYPSPNGDMTGGEGTSKRAIDNFESHLLKVLELMDLSNSTRKPRLNLRRSTGHTMLHLACKLGLHRFVAGLLARGANADLRDKGGYTALHMAALNSHPEIVRLLIGNGADPSLRTLSGLTAAEMAKSKDVLRLILRFEHKRTQSSSLPHSRVNSVTNLNSLRAQATLSQEVSCTSSDPEPKSEDESPEYSEVLSEDILDVPEGPVGGDEAGLRMRRGKSNVNTPARGRSPARPRRRGTDATGALGVPAAAMTAIKEQVAAQFQQLQQMMVPGRQYLPQFPQFPQLPQLPQFSQFPYFSQMPQMPNMPPLPEYQAAVLQRIATMIGGARPGSGEDEPSAKDPESRWRYPLSSATTAVATPPPAYDELFPHQGDLDTKQSSAAQAAVEAEADAKCATLYDRAQTSSAKAANVGSVVDEAHEESEGQAIPALLQIGRKSAITREQQVTLRRAHAQNLKKLSWDRNLFFIWIPLLTLIVCAMVYHGMPGFVGAARQGWRAPASGAQEFAAAV
ncbi:hypothetical protein BT67DRAFT_376651 [Trichocladium antarcticum]|uniref:IPT/TIG domain-containing protein n=1 Tax=Trichocladium antarcticum TaxID=1450529 RepID=A0AAN6UMU6_9PEZI|nr:hypothetical protein BT67DRAFT_376651 [Trichocladium antarcticum]